MSTNAEIQIREHQLPEGFLFLPSFRETFDLLLNAYKNDVRVINHELSFEEEEALQMEWRNRAFQFLDALLYYGVYGETKGDIDILIWPFLNECFPVIDYCKKQRDSSRL